MLIYDGLHYDALAVAAFENAPEELDATIFNPNSNDGQAILRGAVKLVGGVQGRRSKGRGQAGGREGDGGGEGEGAREGALKLVGGVNGGRWKGQERGRRGTRDRREGKGEGEGGSARGGQGRVEGEEPGEV